MANDKKKDERSIINEGLEKKGGINPPPTNERPDPPRPRPPKKKEGK